MLQMNRDLSGYDRPDGSWRYPALSCKAIRDCYPDKQDGEIIFIPGLSCMIMPDTIITAYVAFNVWVGYRSEPIFRLSNMRGLPINIAQEERTITFFIVLTAS